MAWSGELTPDPHPDANRARNAAIWQRHLAGASSTEIGAEFGITPARVRVIIWRTNDRQRDEAHAAARPEFIRGHQVGERAAKALRAAGITRWWQLAAADEASLDRLPRIGRTLAVQILAGRPVPARQTRGADSEGPALPATSDEPPT